MRGPVESQFLMAAAYLSSRGPSYRFSTLYFWALSGEGRCQIIISSNASEAGSHACRRHTWYNNKFPGHGASVKDVKMPVSVL